MPYYFLIARNGQETRSSRAYTARDLREYSKLASCYTFVSELTNKAKNVGQGCRVRGRGLRDGVPAAPTAAAPAPNKPAAAPVAGWWPFGKKKQLPRDPRKMAQTIMYIPGEKGMKSRGEMITMRGARRRRRRR